MTLRDLIGTVRREPRRTLPGLLATIVVIGVVVPFVVFAVPQLVGGHSTYVVLSGSMEPAIDVGDVIVVGAANPGAIAVGDVITFTRGTDSIPTTHRVAEVVTDGDSLAFRTKGDANEDVDPGLVPASAVVGTVILTIPLVGYVIAFVNTSTGFAALVVLPFLLLLGNEAYTYYTRSREGEPTDESTVVESHDRSGPTTLGVRDVEHTDGSPFELSAGDLTVSLVILGGFALYSAAVAYVTWETRAAVTIVSVMLAVATVGLLAFGTYLRTTTPALPVSTPLADGGLPDRIVEGSTTGLLEDTPSVTVSSLATLGEMAARDDAWIVHDPDVARYVLHQDGVAYVVEADPEVAA